MTVVSLVKFYDEIKIAGVFKQYTSSEVALIVKTDKRTDRKMDRHQQKISPFCALS